MYCFNSLRIAIFSLTFFISLACVQFQVKTFYPNKSVATFHTELERYSLAQCIKKCTDEAYKGRCKVAGYNSASRRCRLSLDDSHEVLDVNEDSSGVVFIVNSTFSGLCACCHNGECYKPTYIHDRNIDTRSY